MCWLLSRCQKMSKKDGSMCSHGVLMNVMGLAKFDPGLLRCLGILKEERCQEGN